MVTDTVTLSYLVTRTITLTVDVTLDDAREARAMGETCAECAAAVAEVHPLSAWNIDSQDVTPA